LVIVSLEKGSPGCGAWASFQSELSRIARATAFTKFATNREGGEKNGNGKTQSRNKRNA
jgi:hypothetical protein